MRNWGAVALLLACTSLPARAQPRIDGRSTITVSGEATVTAIPDKIVVNLGVTTSDADLLAAKQKNNEIVGNTVRALKGLGIAASQIQTDHLSVRHNELYKRYDVANVVAVIVSDVTRVEEVVSQALLAGANVVHGVSFQTTALKLHREQARELAMKAAKEKAQKLAAVLGEAVGRAIDIHDYSSPWEYWSSWSGSRQSTVMSQNIMEADPGGAEEAGDTIALGRVAISARVTITFELKR